MAAEEGEAAGCSSPREYSKGLRLVAISTIDCKDLRGELANEENREDGHEGGHYVGVDEGGDLAPFRTPPTILGTKYLELQYWGNFFAVVV